MRKNVFIVGVFIMFFGLIPNLFAQTKSTGEYIGFEKAVNIALEHANLTEKETTRLTAELDYDDGIAEYEIDFWKDNVEYEYDVDAKTGEIIKFCQEKNKNRYHSSKKNNW